MLNIMSAKCLLSGRQTTMLAISLLVAVALLFASCSLNGSDAAVGDEFSSDGVNYKITSEDPLEVAAVGYDAGASEVRIPCAVAYDGHDYRISSVGAEAFKDCAALSEAYLTYVETIGASAFSGCTGLTLALFGDSLSSVEGSAFDGLEFYFEDVRLVDYANMLGNIMFEGSGDGTLNATIWVKGGFSYSDLKYTVLSLTA